MSQTSELRVTSVIWKSPSVRAIELRSPDREELPRFTVGAHVDLHLPIGLVRSYSIMNNPSERHHYLLGIAKDPRSRGGSAYVHDHIQVGQCIRVGAPRNLFPLDETAKRSVLLGGGIGITPLVGMAARLHELGLDWTMHYAVRSREEAAFAEDLEQYGDRVRVHCDDEEGGVLDIAPIVANADQGSHFYCCGPAPMMHAFGTHTRHIEPSRVHVEHFTPIQEANAAGGFLVELARSGHTVAIPEGSTILEALSNAGVSVPSSCQQGVCGTCEVAVLAGKPDHRDSILTERERAANNVMMICCSGSFSDRLVLDL